MTPENPRFVIAIGASLIGPAHLCNNEPRPPIYQDLARLIFVNRVPDGGTHLTHCQIPIVLVTGTVDEIIAHMTTEIRAAALGAANEKPEEFLTHQEELSRRTERESHPPIIRVS